MVAAEQATVVQGKGIETEMRIGRHELLAYLAISLVLAFFATGHAAGPIALSLGFRTSDILSYLVINANPGLYDGSVYGQVADIVTNGVPFNWLLAALFSEGRAPEYLHVALFFLNTTLKCFLFLLIGRLMTGRFFGGLAALVLIIFMIETTLIPYRIISSTIAQTVAMGVVAAALYGRFRLAAGIAGITTCIHPTMGLFVMGADFVAFIAVSWFSLRSSLVEMFKESAKVVGLFFLFASPFFLMSALEVTSRVIQPQENQELWWYFLPTINNLAFPLERGWPNFVSYIGIFFFSAVMVLVAASQDRRAMVVAAIMLSAVIGYVVQAFFTSVYPSQLVAQLALNHRANMLAVPLVYVSLLFAMSRSVKKFDLQWLAWVGLILALLFFDDWSLFKTEEPLARVRELKTAGFVQADTLLAILVAYVLTYGSRVQPIGLMALLVTLLIAFGGWAFNKDEFYFFLVPVALWFIGTGIFPTVMRLINHQGSGSAATVPAYPPGSVGPSSGDEATHADKLVFKIHSKANSVVFIVLATVLVAGLADKLRYKEAFIIWNRFVQGEMYLPWVKYFLDQYVPESDHIVLMPLRGPGVWLSPVPWRRAYLDSASGHFLLYQPFYIQEYLRKLKPYAGTGELEPRWYMDQSIWRTVTRVRQGMPEIVRIDPKAKWVLTFDKFLCGDDKVYATYDGYGAGPPGYLGKVVLVKVSEFDSACEYPVENGAEAL